MACQAPTGEAALHAHQCFMAERRALYRGTFISVQALREAIRQFIDTHNTHAAKPFRWTQNAAVILAKVERAKQSISRKSLN